MIAPLIIVPLLFALVALSLPSDRLRPWLLPIGGTVQLGLVITALLNHAPAPLGNWFGIDPLSRLILLLVSLLFWLCSLYGLGYLRLRLDWGNRIFVTCLLVFLGAMSMAAMARHLGILWVAVEATTLASAPLIYFNHNRLSIEAT